jgi:antitoxin VapB
VIREAIEFHLPPSVYTIDVYYSRYLIFQMPKTDTAKLFQNGRSQAVRLPREFRFEGDRVRIRRVGEGVLLQPIIQGAAEWFEKLDELNSVPFMAGGRRQPATPKRKLFT